MGVHHWSPDNQWCQGSGVQCVELGAQTSGFHPQCWEGSEDY